MKGKNCRRKANTRVVVVDKSSPGIGVGERIRSSQIKSSRVKESSKERNKKDVYTWIKRDECPNQTTKAKSSPKSKEGRRLVNVKTKSRRH